MSQEERTERQGGADSLEATLPRTEPHRVDDLSARIAELDAIAWNLPRAPEETGPPSDRSGLEPAV
jgi:hypothetical protein